MTAIHPSAIIERGAQIDEMVEIGPYTTIGAQVRIGAGTQIGAHSVIEGCTTLGEYNRIGHFVALGGAPQDMKYCGELTCLDIGHRNTIREFTTIHVGTVQGASLTRVGNDNWMMAYVHIAHDCTIGSHTILSNNVQMAGHVQVDDWATLGGMSGVHQHVRIGAHSMLGGASALIQDLPPFMIAAGNKAKLYGINVEGLRRREFTPATLTLLRTAYRVLYKSDFSLEEAKIQLNELAAQAEEGGSDVRTLVRFISGQTNRGILR